MCGSNGEQNKYNKETCRSAVAEHRARLHSAARICMTSCSCCRFKPMGVVNQLVIKKALKCRCCKNYQSHETTVPPKNNAASRVHVASRANSLNDLTRCELASASLQTNFQPFTCKHALASMRKVFCIGLVLLQHALRHDI